MPMIDIQDGNDCFTNDEEGFVDNVEAAYSGAMSEILDNHKDKMKRSDPSNMYEDKPEKMDATAESAWNSKDKKARGAITLALTRSVAFNIMHETTAREMMSALSNMYEKPSTARRASEWEIVRFRRPLGGTKLIVKLNLKGVTAVTSGRADATTVTEE
ncbi:hypothetical protein R6Q59_028406 [Mikania micrantha]